MWLFLNKHESSLLIDPVGRSEHALRPQGHLFVASGSGKTHAFANKRFPQAYPTCAGLNEQQTQLRRIKLLGVLDKKDAAQPITIAFGNPAALALWIIVDDEIGDDARDQCFKMLVPPILLRVQRTVTAGDPSHVSWSVLTQDVRRRSFRCQYFFNGFHRTKKFISFRWRESVQ